MNMNFYPIANTSARIYVMQLTTSTEGAHTQCNLLLEGGKIIM